MSTINKNISAHDAIASTYDKRHPEIFNETEQTRLHEALQSAKAQIKTGQEPPKALDFGCGTGNLSAHLLQLGFDITSADVTPKFLQMIETKFSGQAKTVQLNGEDLSNFDDNTFDFVATYSVLHHIPDYLKAVEELVRVVKPGGVLFIDHEHNAVRWSKDDVLEQFYTRNPQRFPFHKLWNPINYVNKLRRIINPRFQPEGDIHVFEDDHIEWDKIEQIVNKQCELLTFEDYLLFKGWYNEEDYTSVKQKTSDMKLLVGRKR